MKNYIGDDQVILNLQGLRWISKEDSINRVLPPDLFYLQWNYKGSGCSLLYPDKKSRDDMYHRVREALTGEKEKA